VVQHKKIHRNFGLSAGTLYVGGLHGGKNLAQDAAHVFGLVIGDQIGKLKYNENEAPLSSALQRAI